LEVITKLPRLRKVGEIKVLKSSNKHKLASMALMALAVTTLMGTPAALATNVAVSGSVGCAETIASLTGISVPSLGAIRPGNNGQKNIVYTLNQGTSAFCVPKKGAYLTAAMGTGPGGEGLNGPTGQAAESITGDRKRVGLSVFTGPHTGAGIPVIARVPDRAESGVFGGTVLLTLNSGS
jgi:hypothetical protein